MKDNRYSIRFGSRKIRPEFGGADSTVPPPPLHGLMKRGMRAQGGESQEGGIANGGALKERFRRIVSRLLPPPLPLLFPASGNARVRLSVWKGEGGGGERGGKIILPGMLHRLLD